MDPSTPSTPMASPFTGVADSPFVNRYNVAPSPFEDDLLQVLPLQSLYRGTSSAWSVKCLVRVVSCEHEQQS